MLQMFVFLSVTKFCPVFSSPGRSPGRAIVLPPALALASALAVASALAKSLKLKFFM